MAGAASSRASRSWARSTSWTSSTSSSPAATAPAGEQVRVAFELGDRAEDQVIEVESAAGRHGGLVGHERAGDRPGAGVRRDLGGRDAQLDLEPRDRRVEPEELGLVRPRRDRGEDRRAVGERLDRDAGIAQDLAAEGMERADADRAGLDAERRHGRIESFGHLDRRPLVEGDRPDRVRAASRSRSARPRGRPASSSCRSPPGRCTTTVRAARSPRRAGRAPAGRAARRRRDAVRRMPGEADRLSGRSTASRPHLVPGRTAKSSPAGTVRQRNR